MKFFILLAILGINLFRINAQTIDTSFLKNESIAVLMELPYEHCLVFSSCGGGLIWKTTLKYEVIYPIKDTILVRVICPYTYLKHFRRGKILPEKTLIKLGFLVELKLTILEEIKQERIFDTYIDETRYARYQLVELKKAKGIGLKQKGLQKQKNYLEKYKNSIQDPKGQPCACCPK